MTTGRLYWLLLFAVVAFAAWVRLDRLDLMEFKADEANALRLVEKWQSSGHVPRTGLMSSVGVPNPPGFAFALIGPVLISRNPLWITAFIALCGIAAVVLAIYAGYVIGGSRVALIAGLLLSASPWAWIYSRKIWAQNLLPLCSVLLILTLLKIAREPRWPGVFFLPPLLALIAQLHFSGVILVPVAAVFLIAVGRRHWLNWSAVFLGGLVAAALCQPYCSYLWRSHFGDFGNALAQVAGQEIGQPSRWEIFSLSLKWLGAVTLGGGFAYNTGQADGGFLASPICETGSWACPGNQLVSVLAGLVVVISLIAVPLQAFWRDEGGGSVRGRCRAAAGELLLSAWGLAVPLAYAAGHLKAIFPHYFSITLVPMCLLAAIFLGRTLPELPIRGAVWPRLALATGPAFAVLAFGAGAFYIQAFNSHLERRGGTEEEYEVCYRHQKAVVERLALGKFAVRLRAAGLAVDGRAIHYLLHRAVGQPKHAEYIEATVYNTLREKAARCQEQESSFTHGPLLVCYRFPKDFKKGGAPEFPP